GGIELIEDFISLSEEQQAALGGISAEELQAIRGIIDENVEVVEEEAAAEEGIPEEGTGEEEEAYECPDCGARVTPEMTHCPSCGVELSFEYEDDQES
ncbi:MAG TPA: zinc ribbon domain-containing protein, partial [Spirochaetales bacterium]|nr:zinc ribbon domain-containing protein [Spirochaetales bacterium]